MSEARLHPCDRCAGMQKTCCQRAEILVTQGDVARIRAYVCREDFDEWRAPEDAAYSEPDEEDPHWILWSVRGDGRRHVLRRRPDGDCGFLGAQGCELPEGVRPLVCRLYPFEYTEERILGEAPEYCPTASLRPPEGLMSRLLGMRLEDADSWRRALYAELQKDHEHDASRTHLRPAR